MLNGQECDMGEPAYETADRLAARQAGFAAALLDPDHPMPFGLVGPDGKPSARRFNVYRNNVVAGLTATLKDAYPAVARLVGGEFFAAMARTYVAGELPRSPIMLDYGAGFPDFVGSFEPAGSLPYLRDVARIERAWLEAYHAADAQPLDPAALARIAPNDLPYLRLVLHPSLRLVRSPFPALTIWQMSIEGGTPAPVDLASGGEDTLVLRATAEVKLRALPPGGATFVQALADGRPVLAATTAALSADGRFDLSCALAGLMAAGAFVGAVVMVEPRSPDSAGLR